MDLYWTPLLIPFLLSAFVFLYLGIFGFRNRRLRAAIPFLISIIAGCIWLIAYIFEIASVGFEQKIFWANIQFFGIALAPVFWLETTMRILGRKGINRWIFCLLLVIPAVTVLLAWTDGWHRQFRINPELDYSGIILLKADYGYWHNYIFVPFQYILYGLSLLHFIMARIHANEGFRSRYSYLIAAMVIPMGGSLFYALGIPPFENLHPTSAAFALTGLFFCRAISTHGILEIQPLARGAIVEDLRNPILVMDRKNQLIDYNTAAKKLFFLSHREETLIGMRGEDIFPDNAAFLRTLDADSSPEVELKLETPRGARYFSSRISPVLDFHGSPLGKSIVFSDITEMMSVLEQLKTLATIDELTKLYNRRYFFERGNIEFERARRYGKPISIMIIDLDLFKRINDTFGHSVGDRVLRSFADCCREELRTSDFMGRYGGEEFVFCFPETKVDEARKIVERIRVQTARSGVNHQGEEIFISFSGGLAGIEKVEEETLDELLIKADHALYNAKENGRDKVIQHNP